MWLTFACVGALVVYGRECARLKQAPDLRAIIECPLSGAAIYLGIHLLLCTTMPSLIRIGEIVDVHTKVAPEGVENLTIKIDSIHSAHLIGAGAATAYLGAVGLIHACRRLRPEPARSPKRKANSG